MTTDKHSMERPIAKITKENHFNNLVNNLPLFTSIFAIQCAMAHFVFSEIIDPGSFAIILGTTLITLFSFIYAYDRHHHIFIYKDKIHVHFNLIGSEKVIPFATIKKVLAPEQECEFASLSLVLKNDEVVDFHFIDYPVQVKKIILKYIEENQIELKEEFKVAA